MRSFILVALGGAFGASARYGAGLLATRWAGKGFPWGTLVVNIVGSLCLGWVLAESHRYDLSDEARLLLGTGICGALTTFSTFSIDTIRLLEKGHWGWAGAYLLCNLSLGLGAAWLGLQLGRG